jgi:hypothetical protein
VRIAINLPAHVDWAARRRLYLGGAGPRLFALAVGLGFLLGLGAVAQLLASAAAAFAEVQSSPPPASAAAIASTPVATPRAVVTPTSTPLPPTPTAAPLEPDFVARIRSSRLQIDHYVVRLGVINNQMQSPDADGVHAIGWYPEYATPGRGGNAVFSAHETWTFQHGPFYSMHLARPGDEITIEMTSGAVYRYTVTSNRRYPEATIPMHDIIWSSSEPEGEEWATFITCGGRFVPTRADGLGEYLDRDIVVARRVS